MDKNHSVLKPHLKWVEFTLDQLLDRKPVNGFGDIDRNTICRFTGLKDKNDKEIYEGDIVDTFHEKWPKEHPGRFTENGTPPREVKWIVSAHHNGWNIYFGKHSQYEVIGNIYSDPHLLEKSK